MQFFPIKAAHLPWPDCTVFYLKEDRTGWIYPFGHLRSSEQDFCWKTVFWFARLGPMSILREVIVYSRKGCHLCEIVKEKLSKLERRGGFRWREVDVETDDQLKRQFTDEVPVVFIDGRKAFKYRLDEQEFLKKLAS
jgi:glutaredoxin